MGPETEPTPLALPTALRRGPFDLRAANAIGFLAGILLKALDQRVESPETTNSEASSGIYMSLFQRLNSAAPQQEVSNYFRNRNNKLKPAPPVPAPSEFVDDTPTRPNTHPRVITVEVG
jgi:hypothetical protein